MSNILRYYCTRRGFRLQSAEVLKNMCQFYKKSYKLKSFLVFLNILAGVEPEMWTKSGAPARPPATGKRWRQAPGAQGDIVRLVDPPGPAPSASGAQGWSHKASAGTPRPGMPAENARFACAIRRTGRFLKKFEDWPVSLRARRRFAARPGHAGIVRQPFSHARRPFGPAPGPEGFVRRRPGKRMAIRRLRGGRRAGHCRLLLPRSMSTRARCSSIRCAPSSASWRSKASRIALCAGMKFSTL